MQQVAVDVRPYGRQSGIYVAVEYYQDGDDTIVLLHAVVPLDDHTYEVIEKLWKKYRNKL